MHTDQFSPLRSCIHVFTDRNPSIAKLFRFTLTIPDLALNANVSVRTIKRELATLQEAGLLSREEGKKAGRWVVKITL